jgi:hypothetical protein
MKCGSNNLLIHLESGIKIYSEMNLDKTIALQDMKL